MRTMFVAQANNNRKRFQKPNILRRRTKASEESPVNKPLITTNVAEPKFQAQSVTKVYKACPTKKVVKKSANSDKLFEITGYDGMPSILVNTTTDSEDNGSIGSFNVESFINSTVPVQNISLQEIEDVFENGEKDEWSLDFINNAQEIIIEDVDGSHLGSLRVAPTGAASAPLSAESSEAPATQDASTPPIQNLTLEYLASSTMNFKCDVPDCKKRFRSEQKLNKHKLVHNSGPKAVKQLSLECPVKKTTPEGAEEPCGTICASKEELVNHLNQSHDPEEAMYVCSECGRRFFWASGLRAHSRAHCGRRAALACGWPGCGREFRQPCRLREHMRAHTGDKPYPCHFPNCGWSFRTASKLVRHALRHTGERRHACGACGRAFRRREHLRDHARRHHAAHDATSGCKKDITEADSLKDHIDLVNEQSLVPTSGSEVESVAPIEISLPDTSHDEVFMPHYEVSVGSPVLETECGAMADSSSMEAVDARAVCGELAPDTALCHAARTHCTWPLDSRTHFTHTDDTEYVMEGDVQVELSEGSESNIYTIRSDLFLHGNVLTNEDSEQMSGGAGSLLVVGDENMGLLDSHPSGDLLQEELMYTDSAVDESSFRVFLLSGEELS